MCPRRLLTGILSILLLAGCYSFVSASQLYIPFCHSTIELSFDEKIQSWHPEISRTASSGFSFESLAPYHPELLVQSLNSAAQSLQLTDWHYLTLLRKVAQAVLPLHTPDERELLVATLLHLASYRIELFQSEKGVEIYGYCTENIAETPWFTAHDSTFYNLTYLQRDKDSGSSLKQIATSSKNGTRAFRFYLHTLPSFPVQPITRSFTFVYRDSAYTIHLQLDQTILEWMAEYPEFSDNTPYIETPLSPTLKKSMQAELERLTKGLSMKQTVELITAFVRSLPYQSDSIAWGREKPFFPDEVLAYPFSDCEDRVALCYALTRAFTPVAMAVLSLPNHLTLAVELVEWEEPANALRIDERTFFLNDPTAPLSLTTLKKWWYSDQGAPYEVILRYLP